ncbi:MAG: serine/threonine protein kinase [Pirellulales bacterium]|nr:serine/threonine protein kinase [Pirellulales bacterium]
MPDEPVSTSTHLQILRKYAQGGLGQVSVALDRELNREVALKEILADHAMCPASRNRFVREAEITGSLEHPGVVPVYGMGQYSDGRPFYAMRFIKGKSLQSVIEAFHAADRPGRDPGERSLALRKLLGHFLNGCHAVGYAHSRGVLHRDLKPDNVILGDYGETLVVDWGLAKVVGQSEEVIPGGEKALIARSGGDAQETRMGSAIGTPAYMSPEQAAGQIHRLGPATDIYALGATLYAILTGRSPVDASSQEEMLASAIVGNFPRPRDVKPGIPRPLETVCLKAMATDYSVFNVTNSGFRCWCANVRAAVGQAAIQAAAT